MKKIVISLFFISSVFCYAKNGKKVFLQANELYAQKEYAKALNLYNTIEKKGPATWYNMGNCAFRLGNYVYSLLYWKKAKKEAPFKDMRKIDYNIALAYEKLDYAKPESWFSFVQNYVNAFSLFFLQILFLILWLIFFVLLFGLKRYRTTLLFVLLVFNTFLFVAVVVKYRAIVYPKAIVTKPSISVFSGPDENFHVIGNLSLADELQIKKQRNSWYKISYNHIVGWVSADSLEIV